jgi:hypothetical protein
MSYHYSFLDSLKLILISGQKPFSHLQNDKAKIKNVIEELDEKKKETLKVTWLKVNKSVYEPFSDLLYIPADALPL